LNLIFDFDGTLADSFDVLYDYLRQTQPEFKLTKEELRLTTIPQLLSLFKVRAIELPQIIYKIQKEMRLKLQEVAPFPFVKDMLVRLVEDKRTLSIVSSNSMNNIEYFLSKHQLRPFFQSIHCEIDIFGKARKLEKLIRQRKMDRTQTYYVGDESRDIEAARKVKIKSIAVNWGFSHEDLLRGAHPDYLVRSPEELFAISS
jgi:phosphoglycolate phosphatase